MKKSIVLAGVVAAFVLGFAFSSSMTTMPMDLCTANRILALENAIRKFVRERGELPANLKKLSDMGYVNERQTEDRWGNAIEYDVVEGMQITLVSRGDPDIAKTFGCEYRISRAFSVEMHEIRK